MTMNQTPTTAPAKKPVQINRRRFAVLWTTGRQDRRSAPMTSEEADRFVERLRKDSAVSEPRIEEHHDPLLRGSRGRT